MRFMMIVHSDEETESGALPDEALFTAMDQYNEALHQAGVLLAAEGLQPSGKGARIVFSGDERTVTEGPFPDADKLIAGFWILNVASREEAIEWARRVPFDSGEIELRQIYELADFPEELREADAAQHEQQARSELRAP